MQYTPENIETLKPNEIFVFGSNTEGIHGGGAAWVAKEKFGAIIGKPVGLQGQSYAIVTKGLSIGIRSMSIEAIRYQVEELYRFAKLHSDLTFIVTKIGCGLGGFETYEIADVFKKLDKPTNIILPKEFSN